MGKTQKTTGLILVFFLVILGLNYSTKDSYVFNPLKADFSLYQLPPQGSSQMLSDIIETTIRHQLIVVDGGTHDDSSYLCEQLKSKGGHVSLWIITHPHPDHIDAITDTINHLDGIQIDEFCLSFPSRDWIQENEKEYINTYDDFQSALSQSGIHSKNISAGDVINIDGSTITFFSQWNPDIIHNAINNSSLVFKMTSAHKTVLFLGDAGVDEGEKILRNFPREMLKSEYVQMAHHGQNGVSEEFYKAVSPKFCLWPTPLWLWNNDNGGGENSGPWKTLEVRQWMKKLNVQANYVAYTGLIYIP